MKTFEKFSIGDMERNNRIVMAPLTRSRAIDNIPNALMSTYYVKRATAGLIISEGTSPSPNGLGYPRIPGAYSDAQIQGWKFIAEDVYDKGGKLFVQLMHTGRVTSLLNLPEGAQVLAPSAITMEGEMYTDKKGFQPYDTPLENPDTFYTPDEVGYVDYPQQFIDALILVHVAKKLAKNNTKSFRG